MDEGNIISIPKGAEMVIVPRKEYERLRRLASEDEDDRDIRHADAAMRRVKSGVSSLIPGEVVQAMIIDRMHPLKAWRLYKKMKGGELAAKARLTRTTVSQIENRKRKGTLDAYRALATALDVSLSALIEE